MRLEKIALAGFKSFGEKTEFSFDSGTTAIVGPNGCGKSNIVDAVRWALGEQSVKSLRSEYMADVIFSGGGNRRATGMAEVSLFISDFAGQLPIEAPHLQITRRLYRSGESEYLVNNKLCRLKDIRELFMDTGLGVRAYSIIEQGQIEQLLNASRFDRRTIFEEAAGISKYKAHKKEALRKLERTEQNLLRLADILAEVQKQLRSIKLQATKAKNYLQYSQKLKELRVNYGLAEFHQIKVQSEKKNSVLTELEDHFAAVAADVVKYDTSLSHLGNEVIQTENEINRSDNSLVTVKSRIEQYLQRIEFLRTQVNELVQRKANTCEQIQKLRQQTDKCAFELIQSELELENNEKTLTEKQQMLQQLQEVIEQTNRDCTCLEAQLEDEKCGTIDIVRRTTQLHNEVQSISTYRDNLAGQKRRLSDRAKAAKEELERLLTEKAQHQSHLNDIEKVVSDLQQSLDAKSKKIKDLNTELTRISEWLAHSKEARSALEREATILTDMENRREGLSTAVKTIWEQKSSEQGKFDYIEGIIAEVIEADVRYAKAVEAVLEGKTDALIINNTDKFINDRQAFAKLQGRANFICADRTEPFVDTKDLSKIPSVRDRLIEFVNYDGKYAPVVWKLLGHVIVVDSIDAAAELAIKLGSEYKFVTPKGQLFNNDGTITIGPLNKTTGLISRKSRLRQLQSDLAGITAEIAGLQANSEKNTQQNEHLVNLCKDLRTDVYEANSEKTEVTSKLALIKQNIKRLTDEQPLIGSEINLLEEQTAQSLQKECESKQKLQALEAASVQRTARIEGLQARLAQLKEQHQLKTNELSNLRVTLGQITEQCKALKQTILTLRSQKHQGQTALESMQADVLSSEKQIARIQANILNCETAVSDLFVRKEQAAQKSSRLHKKVEQLLEKQKQTEQLLRQRRAEQADREQQIHQLKIELSQFEVKLADLLERVQEELQIDLLEAYKTYRNEEVDWDRIKDEIATLRGKIERLGNVNVDAIGQQKELERRNGFLAGQAEDLNRSKTQLQQLINKLNRQSKEKFTKTFEEIRANFQQVFRKLFGGGKADIMLDDPDDILEAGIEIIARPPGKETRSITLLSGGEKAMTAIALLFAVFRTKPSPFCLLDEVDAALDEANIERFNLIIKEFEKNSQFVIITHSKRTMSIADTLFGITMQRQGISKKISVKFDKFDTSPLDTPVAVA